MTFLRPVTRSRPGRLGMLLITSAVALLLGACGNGDSTTATSQSPGDEGSPAGSTVEIERSRFAPEQITIGAGGTVEFVNLDPSDHTVTATDQSDLSFDSGPLGPEQTFSQQFEEPGTYDYFCKIHPTMRASVIVQ